MITTSMGMWREQLADTPETGVQVPARTANKKLRYLNGLILFLYHVNGKVKYNLQNILFCVLVVMRSVVWVNTLQVQVRVPARKANKKLRCRFESPHARLLRREYPQGARGLWVNTLHLQVRVPARTANKKLRYLNGVILFLNHVNGKVKYNLQNILFCVLVVMRSVVWVNTLQVQVRVPARNANKKLRCRFESPHARLLRREYPQGARVVWVNTLQVQVRVPARTANEKLRYLNGVILFLNHVNGLWVNTLHLQVRVPARTANKKLRYLNGVILFLNHVNGKVKYNLQNILFCVLVVMRSVVWVNTLQVQPFKKEATKETAFKLNKNDTKQVKMMYHKARFPLAFIPEANCRILELPYEGKELSMLICLPMEIEDGTTGLEKLEAMLTYETFMEWTRPDRMGQREVNVGLPRFKMTQTYDMKDLLVSMGMVDAFDQGLSDFSGMSSANDLVLSKVVHKAFVEVNEEGTEAAAATACGDMMCCLIIPPRFVADHPFLFFIRHNPSKSILFAGRYSSPE
ncbi:unnamed protein product [Boreogadus saida]